MNNLKILILLLACLAINACKKEEINSQEFVKNHIIGKWPLKQRISFKIKNNDTITKDTIIFNPIDTVLFTKDGKYSFVNTVANYQIDAKGEILTLATSPEIVWTIKYLRTTSIILSKETTEKIGADKFIYYTEERLIK